MDENETLGNLFVDRVEGLAEAQTLALIGRQHKAQSAYATASFTFTQWEEDLKGYPGYQALLDAIDQTIDTLSRHQEED